MRNSNGYLKKILSLFSFVLLSLFLNPVRTYAKQTFTVTSDFIHTITTSEINTEVQIEIASENTQVLSYYTATIPQEELTVKCYDATTGDKLVCSPHSRTGATDILIDFNNAVIKASKPYRLKLLYSTTSEVASAYNLVSSLSDATTSTIQVTYPKDFGEPLWTSDTIQNIKSVGSNYDITIQNPVYSTLSILFGKQISYSFSISKTFTNSSEDENQTFEILVPPDTQTQTIVWDNIAPLPNTTELDEDGNYIFKYILTPGTTTDCNITGHIIKHKTTVEDSETSTFLTYATGYWNTNEKTEFTRINTYLKNKGLDIPEGFSDATTLDVAAQELLYKYLYQYVINRLTPEEELSDDIISDNNRVGFDNLLSNTNALAPADYTDFLITVLRSYNIPARQIIGYVSNISGYTSDGFYSYWAEAYDYATKEWVTMDPFLDDYAAKTLYGSDYYDHIAIIRRGKASASPKLTFYKDSDFLVTSSAQDEITTDFNPSAQIVFDNHSILDSYVKGLINIANNGNIAITGYTLSQSSFDNLQSYVDPVNNINSQIILPTQNATIQFNIPNPVKSSNAFINITFKNESFSKALLLESQLSITKPVFLVIIAKVFSIGIFAGLSYLIYFVITKIKKHKNE